MVRGGKQTWKMVCVCLYERKKVQTDKANISRDVENKNKPVRQMRGRKWMNVIWRLRKLFDKGKMRPWSGREEGTCLSRMCVCSPERRYEASDERRFPPASAGAHGLQGVFVPRCQVVV